MGLQVESGDRILRFVFTSATPARDIYAVFHRAFAEAPRDDQVVIDLRASTSLGDRTPEFVRMITEFIVLHPERPGERMAVLLPPEEVERWKKLAADVDMEGVEIGLFEDIDDAETWALA